MRRSAAKELYIAADIGQPITFNEVYSWSTQDFRKRHPIPVATANEQLVAEVAHIVVRSGNANGCPISLYKTDKDYLLYSPKFDLYSLMIRFPDRDFLEKYFRIVYGPITWNE